MANTKIVLNRQSDLILDNALITNPQGIVLTDISGVSEAVASINSATSVAISSEASYRSDDTDALTLTINNGLSIENARAISIENSLEYAMLEDSDTHRSIELSIEAAMSAEISTRVVAETSLQNNIDAEASTGLVRDNAEASMARAAEQSVATDLIAEQSRAESAELSLNTKVEFVISNTDAAALDSLTEIVSAFQSADGDINGAITALGSAATVAVDNEASIRLAADQSLAGDLSSEIADREAAVSLEEAARISGDSSLELELSAEIEARISGDASLESFVNQVQTNAADNLQYEVSKEQSARLSVDASLESFVNQVQTNAADNLQYEVSKEKSARLSVDASLESFVNQVQTNANDSLQYEVSKEQSTRLSVDVSLESFVNQVQTNAADNLQYEVSKEQSTRIDGDQSLQNQIDFITNNTDAAALDSLTEIVAAFQSADGDINNAITTLAGAAGADLSTEVARATNAEALLTANLSIEISDREYGYEVLDAAKLNLAGGTMSGNINMGYNSIDNINNVHASAYYGEYALINGGIETNSIGTENNTSPLSVRSNLDLLGAAGQMKIINSPAPTDGGDAANKTYVDGVSSTISTEISTSVSDRVAADESLAAELSSEIESLALTDETTIELNTADNTIKLKDTVASPASGIRTFMGEVDVETILKVAGVDVMATLSSEVSRAESAEASIAEELSSEVSYIMANTDLSSIDSFAEVVADLSSEVSRAESVEATKLDLAGGTMSGNIDMNGRAVSNGSVTNMSNISTTNIRHTDSDSNVTVKTDLTFENNYKITDLAAPTNGGDAANKLYVDSEVSTEVARAEAAEASIALDFANIYAKHIAVTETPDGSVTSFTLANVVREGSELIYLNGLLLDSEDYTPTIVDGKVTSVTFFIAPSTGDKVRAYGVC